jgi:DNA/RNA-binding domain of Phe-tRNA-synthetase-like protein
MSLPLKTSNREDALPLQRAIRALDDARKSLKAFSQTQSVKTDPSLATSLEALRRKVKRARKLGKEVASRWMADANS